MIAYKFLGLGAIGPFSAFPWPETGVWVEADTPPEDCVRGVHALRFEQLLDWIDDELWEVELDGVVVERDAMLVAQRGRLLQRIDGWNGESAHAFARGCALRSASLAAAALDSEGMSAAAHRLESASDVAGIQLAAVEALSATSAAELTNLVAFAADLGALVSGNRPDTWLHGAAPAQVVQTPGAVAANAGFVGAHIAGYAALAAGGTEDAYAAAFARERARQLAEFASYTHLTASRPAHPS